VFSSLMSAATVRARRGSWRELYRSVYIKSTPTGAVQGKLRGVPGNSRREALGAAIAEIDTTAVLTRHDVPIDNRGVEMSASD
jgi:hypothetical protein